MVGSVEGSTSGRGSRARPTYCCIFATDPGWVYTCIIYLTLKIVILNNIEKHVPLHVVKTFYNFDFTFAVILFDQ